ncbi:MAG: FecR family protein [Ferruginibacter sp.]
MEKDLQLYNLLARKLSGEASSLDIQELNNLLSESYENRQLAQTLEYLWKDKINYPKDAIKEERFNYIIECLREDEEERGKIVRFWNRYRYYIAAAASIPLIFFIFTLFSEKEQKELPKTAAIAREEAITPPGSRKQMILPDGTKAWLNAGSKLTYPKSFNAQTREVELEGEAYFDVVKNEQKPFIVHTSGIDIRVLGTIFNVKDYATDPSIEATLLRGMIEVVNKNDPGASKVILKPHEKLIFAKKRQLTKTSATLSNYTPEKKIARPDITISSLTKNIADSALVETAWVYNKLVFEEESFEDIAIKMERWYNVKISFKDEKLKNYRMSGSFVRENVTEALDVLQMLVPFTYVYRNGAVFIAKKRK